MKKTLTMVLAFALVFALGVGGTLAWLTASTGEVKNTFTVGDINITLTETDAGVGIDTDTTDNANEYHFVPGDKLDKDPKVTVAAGSEKCYVFVKLDVDNNKIGDVEVLSWTMNSNWTAVKTTDEYVVYKYNSVVDAATAAQELYILNGTEDQVSVNENVTKEMVKTINAAATKPTMTFTAYAHQSANTTYEAAEAAAIAHFA